MKDEELYSKKDGEIAIGQAIEEVIKKELNPAIERHYQLGYKHGFKEGKLGKFVNGVLTGIVWTTVLVIGAYYIGECFF